MIRHKGFVVAAVISAALMSGAWFLQRETEPAGSVYQQARLFDDVLAHVADYYVDSLDERQLYQMAIDGMLDQLHDPYSVFLKRDDFRALNEATTGNYGGLGIQIDVRDGWITVVAPLPDTPAERAGIQSGDQIIALDGRSTEGWKNDQAVKQLRGEPGSAVELKVRRVGVDGSLAFKLTRATIHIRSVQVSMMLDDKVGYVLLSPVSETSAQEMTDAVTGLVQKGMKSLVLDLRNNPGGLLDQGVAVSELFLDPGQEVVATRGRATNTSKTYRDAKPQPWPNLPVVVLTNGGTASAAEIIFHPEREMPMQVPDFSDDVYVRGKWAPPLVFAANYPLTEEDLEAGRLPGRLEPHRRKLFALSIKPERLQQIRNERRPDSRYSSRQQVQYELRAADALFTRYAIPCLDTTECSIEEIASRILNTSGIERRLRP